MFFTRYKPNPLPLSLEPSGLWAWRNLWKISNRFSWDIPIPVSLIEISISDPKSLTETYILPSTFVNFTALERRLNKTLSNKYISILLFFLLSPHQILALYSFHLHRDKGQGDILNNFYNIADFKIGGKSPD